MLIILTTSRGIEDIVEREIEEKVGAFKNRKDLMNIPGRVLVELNKESVSKLFTLRSVFHIVRFITSFEIENSKEGLRTIYNTLRSIDLSDVIEEKKKFRVTSERSGNHEFTSLDIQRVAGQAIVDSYGLKVDLENFDLEFTVDVINDKCIVGSRLTKESLHKRGYRIFNHPAALKPVLAYAMVRLADVEEGETLVDPMCGGGTIPIEAAYSYNGKIKIYGFDKVLKYVLGAKMNAEKAGVNSYIVFEKLDCALLSKRLSSIDAIVTNPPYGVRMTPRTGVGRLYRTLASEAYKTLNSNGKFIVITLKSGLMKKILKNLGFTISEERITTHGGLHPHIIVAKK
ncbi:MAG: THUMP domain-containing protein [Thermoproteota archaeon]